jgi:type I restriction enzyme S subunit
MGKVVVVRPDLVRDDYLYWLFLWRDFNEELVASSTGTKILHTAPSRIESFRFRLPGLEEQGAIADILSILTEKIELNRQMSITLEAMARAMFKSWFVDFEPVAAKAAGRQLIGLGARSAELFPSGFQDSAVGSIPRRWTVSRIGDEVRVVGGSTPKTTEPRFWEGGNIHWATPKDLSILTDSVLLDTERSITREGLGQISSGLLPAGTVLLSSRAPIGYLAISEMPTAVNQGFVAMVCKGRLPNYYVLQWAREAMDEIISRAGGTTFAEVSRASFRPIRVLVPDQPVLRAYVEVVRPLYEKIVSNVQESRALSTVRDALLPKLLSGEVRVCEAEKLAGQAGA